MKKLIIIALITTTCLAADKTCPCNDSTYIKLKKQTIVQIDDMGYIYYKDYKQRCEDYIQKQKERKQNIIKKIIIGSIMIILASTGSVMVFK